MNHGRLLLSVLLRIQFIAKAHMGCVVLKSRQGRPEIEKGGSDGRDDLLHLFLQSRGSIIHRSVRSTYESPLFFFSSPMVPHLEVTQ